MTVVATWRSSWCMYTPSTSHNDRANASNSCVRQATHGHREALFRQRAAAQAHEY
jgi:hypothetical protein